MVDPSFEKLTQACLSIDQVQSDFRNANMYPLLVSYLKKQSLLDIGCGSGHFLHYAQQASFEVAGVEPNDGLIHLADRLYRDLSPKIQKLFAEDIGEVKGRYDNISLVDVLEHIQDDVSLLKKIPKLLNPDGQLIIFVPCFSHLYGVRDKSLGHYRRYQKSELIEKLTRCGFEIVSIRYWNMLGYFPYFIFEKILKKPLGYDLRTKSATNKGIKNYLSKILDFWFKYIENQVDFGFGLSLLCVAKMDMSKQQANKNVSLY